MWQSQVETDIIPLFNSTALLCLKRYSAKFLLRVVFLRAAKMHEYLISLHSMYEPRP